MRIRVFLLSAAMGLAQDQTGSVSGVVLDAISHQPVAKANVSLNPRGMGPRPQNSGPQSAITDITGSFSMTNVVAGQYQLTVQHRNYPMDRNGPARKTIEIKAGEKAGPVDLTLIPGASVSGHVVDEDGDPLSGCSVMATPPKTPYSQFGGPVSVEDGTFRLFGISPGKYQVSAICRQPAFQARPFSAAPELPPAAAYQTQYYPATSDVKSAEAVELLPGSEKAGIEFRMRPSPVTQVHGTFGPGVDLRDRPNLMVQMVPADERIPRSVLTNSVIDREKGTFDFPQVFPGSYLLIAFTNGEPAGRVGGMQKIDVKDQPVEMVLNLRPGMNIEGTVQFEGPPPVNSSPNAPPSRPSPTIQLNPEYQIGFPGAGVQVKDDGSFVLESVLPGLWRLRVLSPNGFLKSAWMGTTELTNGLVDLTGGTAGPLKLIVSTNTATIGGTGPPGQLIFAQEIDESFPFPNIRSMSTDPGGQFKFSNLAPGKYRIVAAELEGQPPEEGGQEITVHEGETLMIDVKARSN
ncbi:MAG TPA: carboxypeptidase-like regulatory domain-containing protein [Bryobacteraceae bacterium]|nr:carboxypeptidase-like regulatory domain-containing protein [Bryobacteraceae bacterium]